jgi:membrane-associated phospholipid phosphatase
MLMIAVDPWFAHQNHRMLEALFRLVPHSQTIDDRFDDLISNPFWGTWIFAVVFFRVWAIDDEQQRLRRNLLLQTMVAISASFLVTVAVRPFVSWPAPVLNSTFQGLFPHYLWGQGRWNCFPSHSTLAYFTVAAGFWWWDRALGVCLSLFALAVVSLPRVYLGGHYPIDVVFSCVLGVCALVVVRRRNLPPAISSWLIRKGKNTALRDCLFFLWVFELGEGFRGTEFIAAAVRRLVSGL